MAQHPLSRRDERRTISRRALIKWSLAAGAALGVSRSKIFQVLEDTAGKGVAFAAAENPTRRSISLVAGNGGLAWFQLLWPHHEVAAAANDTFAGYHTPGRGAYRAGTRELFVGPDTPFAALPPTRQMTCFTCGTIDIHQRFAPTGAHGLGSNNIFSVVSALQSVSPSVVPLVKIGQVEVGQAPGAPGATTVVDADGIVGLFNSAASRAGGLLSMKGDAELYRAHYDAYIQLNQAAGRPTTRAAYRIAGGSAGFLGTNLAAKLQITPEDLARYGVSGDMPDNVRDIARAFIVAVKAFRMGLTNSIVMPAMLDDPHTAFSARLVDSVPAQLRAVFDAFMADLTAATDDVTLRSLADDTVITISGDTPKTPFARANWPDNTPGASNLIYVYGAGDLRTGWFGGVSQDGQVRGFDAQGNPAPYNAVQTRQYALASIAYAIAKRDERMIAPFANGLTISGPFGVPKDQ